MDIMPGENSEIHSGLKHHLPPGQPKDYVIRDQYLSRRFGDGVMKSIKKEREGMVRLFHAVEEELNDEAQEVLLRTIIDEMEKLDHLEDKALPFESNNCE